MPTEDVSYDSSKPSLAAQQVMNLRVLMWNICVDYGYCGDLGQNHFLVDTIVDMAPLTAASFADKVFQREGIEKKDEIEKHRRHIEGMFMRFIGEKFDPDLSKADEIALGLIQ